MVMAERIRPPGPFSLLARTNLTLTVSSLLIALVSTIALNFFVIEPIAERSAADEAALLVLSAHVAAMSPGTEIGAAHPVGLLFIGSWSAGRIFPNFFIGWLVKMLILKYGRIGN